MSEKYLFFLLMISLVLCRLKMRTLLQYLSQLLIPKRYFLTFVLKSDARRKKKEGRLKKKGEGRRGEIDLYTYNKHITYLLFIQYHNMYLLYTINNT